MPRSRSHLASDLRTKPPRRIPRSSTRLRICSRSAATRSLHPCSGQPHSRLAFFISRHVHAIDAHARRAAALYLRAKRGRIAVRQQHTQRRRSGIRPLRPAADSEANPSRPDDRRRHVGGTRSRNSRDRRTTGLRRGAVSRPLGDSDPIEDSPLTQQGSDAASLNTGLPRVRAPEFKKMHRFRAASIVLQAIERN